MAIATGRQTQQTTSGSALAQFGRFNSDPRWIDLGLLLFRLVIGVNLFIKHGWFKIALFGNPAAKFPDPFHMGVQLTVAFAFLSDGIGSILVILGLATRFAAIVMAVNLAVAWGAVYHFQYLAPAPPIAEELALYLGSVVALWFTGPGRFSLDGKLSGRGA